MQGRVNTHEGISVCMLRRSPSNGSGWSGGSKSWGGHTQGRVNEHEGMGAGLARSDADRTTDLRSTEWTAGSSRWRGRNALGSGLLVATAVAKEVQDMNTDNAPGLEGTFCCLRALRSLR